MNRIRLEKTRIQENLLSEFKDEALYVFDKIDSTNSFAKAAVKDGTCGSGYIVAETQHAGRGRGDHTWHSPAMAGIYLSIIKTPRVEISRFPSFNLVAAVAAADSLRNETGVQVSLKWPNDLLFEGKKLGGILLERGDKNALITGFGLNINNTSSDFPGELKEGATSLHLSSGFFFDRNILTASLIGSFDSWSKVFEKEPEKVLYTWKEYTSTLGKRVTFHKNGKSGSGIAVDVDHLGFLVVEEENGKAAKLTTGP
ncbi:MAG: biotin--[acetyl-CoA-carboxylase] ligase, partial [Nitrospinota bacterium]